MNREELLKKLELTSTGLAKDDMIKVMQHFCFDAQNQRIIAYNDAVCVTVRTELKDTFALHGELLMKLLKSSSAKEVDFNIDKNEVLVQAGKSSLLRLPYLNKSAFIFKDPPDKWGLTFKLGESVITAIRTCLTTSSRDLAQETLMGVVLRAYKGKLAFYSCDGDAVTRYVSNAKTDFKEAYPLSNAFCEALLKIANEVYDESGVVSIAPEWAKAVIGKYVIYGRPIALRDGQKLLDHEALIKRTLKQQPEYVLIPHDQLVPALTRAAIIADAESAQTVLAVEGGKLYLHTETKGSGEVDDALKLPEHPDVEAHVSASLVQRSVEQCSAMAILENCVAVQSGETLLQIVSNME